MVKTNKIYPVPGKEMNFRGTVTTVDASKIAREELGVPITNTTMLGAVIRATKLVKIESSEGPLKERFGRLAQRNINALRRAYDESKVAKAT